MPIAQNKFNNIGLSAAYLQQQASTFRGSSIQAANLNAEPGAAIEVAPNTDFVSVVDNKVFSDSGRTNTGVRLFPGTSDRCKVMGNSVGHLPLGVDIRGVTGEHNDVAYNL